MAEQSNSAVSIGPVDGLSIVLLKVSRKSIDDAREKLNLASPSSTNGGDPRSLWLGPDRWLLVSGSKSPDEIVNHCNVALAGILHNAVDYSAGLTVSRVAGQEAKELLAAGSAVDFRSESFPNGTCCRTRLAQIAAVIVSEAAEQFDIFVDRSYGSYLRDWLVDSASINRRHKN